MCHFGSIMELNQDPFCEFITKIQTGCIYLPVVGLLRIEQLFYNQLHTTHALLDSASTVNHVHLFSPVPIKVVFQLWKLSVKVREDASHETFLKNQSWTLFDLQRLLVKKINGTSHILLSPLPMFQKMGVSREPSHLNKNRNKKYVSNSQLCNHLNTS